MSEPLSGPRPAPVSGSGWIRRAALAVTIALLAAVFAGAASASRAVADESKVPEEVAAYFATGLIPRLADLYGSPGNTDPASTFDDTTKVGAIHRLLAWTPDFLAGRKTDSPTELTNTWIAPVTAKDGMILGLAAVWINPGNDVVELADFSRGRALVDALGRAPKDTQFIDDMVEQAWFATDGTTLTPLVIGKSGTHGPLTPAEYQKILRAGAVPAKSVGTTANPGLLIAGITLGVVVLALAVFILLPGRKRRDDVADKDAAKKAGVKPGRGPRQDSDKELDREAARATARARSRAVAAVNAEASMADAVAEAGPPAPAIPAAKTPSTGSTARAEDSSAKRPPRKRPPRDAPPALGG